MPKTWIRERKREYFYRKAVSEGYRSRAAYKLFQAVRKYKFIKFGDVVVDLGAAPGSWLQVSREIVGSEGFVLGIDLNYISPINLPNVHAITGDISDPLIVKRIKRLLPRSADVVLSDVSPNISGVWEIDHACQIDLARKSQKIAASLLRTRGNFFVKVFQGDMLIDFIEDLKHNFSFVKIIKPKASRSKSAERYVLGMFSS